MQKSQIQGMIQYALAYRVLLNIAVYMLLLTPQLKVLDALLVMPGTSKNQTIKQTYDDFICHAGTVLAELVLIFSSLKKPK